MLAPRPSHKLRLPRNRYVWLRNITPLIALRPKSFLAAEQLVPRNFLAGVGTHSPHDRQQCAVAHIPAVVDRLAVANAFYQRLVLVDVHALPAGPAVSPRLFAVDFTRDH